MLINLRKIGMKKILQGWVDKNYSWEKLTQQFKFNKYENQKAKRRFVKL